VKTEDVLGVITGAMDAVEAIIFDRVVKSLMEECEEFDR
jgi:hypothetical protein